MKYLHISAQVESRIEGLNKTGKTGKGLTQKVLRIIESLKSGTVGHHMDAIGSYTKYGEKRIRNCRKYDLGSGYRLIIMHRGGKVFILFFGTHDECQRWLENNSRLKKVVVGSGTLVRISCHTQSPARQSNNVSAGFEDEPEDVLPLNISDKDLRRVFSGLVEGAKK